MKRLIVCRHAESLYNVKGLINADSASTASPLTEQGREQARALGQSLSRSAVHLCVTSETPRAVETARLALAGQRVPRVKLSLLNDPPAGHFEDGPVSLFAQWIRDHGIDSVVPGTETTVGASAFRYLDAARLLLSRSEDTVLVIAHAPALRWFAKRRTGQRAVSITSILWSNMQKPSRSPKGRCLRESFVSRVTPPRSSGCDMKNDSCHSRNAWPVVGRRTL